MTGRHARIATEARAVTVAGAGMAGLVAAVRLRELGVEPVVLEKGTRAGGSMLISSCVIWRFRSLDDFREECPGGDPELQRLVVERLDDAIAWLESLGAPVVWQETGNPRTIGKRFDPRGLTDALLARAGEIRLGELVSRDATPLILATGGFSVMLARMRGLLVRSNQWSAGDGIELALSRGGTMTGVFDEFYGRNMPAPPARIAEEDFVRLGQLYGRLAEVRDDDGVEFFSGPVSWSETDLVQATARRPGGTAWYVVDGPALAERIRDRTVAEMVEAARSAGGEVRELEDGRVAVHVMPGVTHTISGLQVDTGARVLDRRGRPIPDLYAAGADVGGISTGGYSSGLASALVLGLTAAETAAG
jgi:succinate dehydrogenase/fumarate reductase flavoprotein subunit